MQLFYRAFREKPFTMALFFCRSKGQIPDVVRVERRTFGPIVTSTDAERQAWLEHVG